MKLSEKLKPVYDHEEAIEMALKTWYPPDHPLHLDPHHPLGKLLGEWGELLDDYMKSLYKPGYVFEPESELGDISYYLRILCYQEKCKPRDLGFNTNSYTDIAIALVIKEIVCSFIENSISTDTLNYVYTVLGGISQRYNLTLDQLTQSNWEKLKPGSVRGDEWTKAR